MPSIPTSNAQPENGEGSSVEVDSSAMQRHSAQHDANNSPSLIEENERLRLELTELRRRMSMMENLQKQQQQQQQEHRILVPSLPCLSDNNKRGNKTVQRAVPDQNKSKTKPDRNDLVLELPLVLSNTGKAKDSVSTADERETEEPPMDIEAHQSSKGLHHRVSPRNSTQNASTLITLSTISTQKSRTLDDENSSTTSRDSYDDEDPLGESRGLIAGELRNRRSQTHEKDANVWVRPTRVPTTDNESHHQMPFCQSLTDRAGWLIGLLVFQSLSSFILAKNQVLLQHHPVIVQFLTMLVGAGGNAGNQASVGVVRGIAVGTVNRSNARKHLTREFAMGVALSLILGLAGFVRAKVFAVPWMETFAITSSLFMIVIISVVVGATLPLAMQAVGIDPAHSSTTIQVIMDISGVVITVHVSAFMLDSDFNGWLTD